MKKPIHIFSPGPQTSSQGVTYNFKPAILKEIVKTYNPQNHHAPIRIGHEDNDKVPAWGWVDGLSINNDGELIAEVDFNPPMDQFIKDKLYRKVSSSFYQPDCKSNPTPGKWSLRHVAMLGGQPPAVKGLKDFAYAEFSDVEGVADFVMGDSIKMEDDDDEKSSTPRKVTKDARVAQKKQDKLDEAAAKKKEEEEQARKAEEEAEKQEREERLQQISNPDEAESDVVPTDEANSNQTNPDDATSDGAISDKSDSNESEDAENTENLDKTDPENLDELSQSDTKDLEDLAKAKLEGVDKSDQSDNAPEGTKEPPDADSSEAGEDAAETKKNATDGLETPAQSDNKAKSPTSNKKSKEDEWDEIENGPKTKKTDLIESLINSHGGLTFAEAIGLMPQNELDKLTEFIEDSKIQEFKEFIDLSTSFNQSEQIPESLVINARALWETCRHKIGYQNFKAQFAEGKVPLACKFEYSQLTEAQDFSESESNQFIKTVGKLLEQFDQEKIKQEYNEQITQLEERNKELEAAKQTEIVAKNRTHITAFVESAFNSGQITPAMIKPEELVDYIECLDHMSSGTENFSENYGEQSASDPLKRLIKAMPKSVEYKEVINHNEPIPNVVVDFHEEALKMAKEKNINYVEALKQTAYPSLTNDPINQIPHGE